MRPGSSIALHVLLWIVLSSVGRAQLSPAARPAQPSPTPKASPSPETKPDLQPLAKNAPEDKPKSFTYLDKLAELIAPYVEKARATLPQTRDRFQKGLQKGEVLFVTVSLHDEDRVSKKQQVEMVFVEVKSWTDEIIHGLLSTDPDLVKRYHRGDKIVVDEKDVLDWTISRPDGTEEGNFVGKFLDTQQ